MFRRPLDWAAPGRTSGPARRRTERRESGNVGDHASIAANTKRTYAAALKRLDAGLAGQDLTDASLALYLASLHAAGLSPAVAAMAVAVGIEGRVSGHSLRVGRAQSLAAGRGLDCRDADGGQVAVTGDAGPLRRPGAVTRRG